MGVLLFDGVDDKIHWSTLAAALQNVGDAAWTVVVLLKRGRISTAGWDSVTFMMSGAGGGTAEIGMGFNDTNKIHLGDGSFSTTSLTSTTSPYLLALSHAAGTVAPRLGFKLGSGGGWTHENLAPTYANQIAGTMLDIGVKEGSFEPGNNRIGIVAYFEGAMSDGNKEALDDNWRTSDIWSNAHGAPAFLAELNVAASSVVDLAGNASGRTVTGTTLDAAETLDSWNFNGTGAVADNIYPAQQGVILQAKERGAFY